MVLKFQAFYSYKFSVTHEIWSSILIIIMYALVLHQHFEKKIFKRKKKFKTNERAGSVPLFHDFNESQEQQWVYEMKNLFLATLSLSVRQQIEFSQNVYFPLHLKY